MIRPLLIAALAVAGTACLDFDYAEEHFCDVSGRCDGGTVERPVPGPDAGEDAGTVGDPRLYIDAPATGELVGSQFDVVGWAVDPSGSVGTGIDRVRGASYGNQIILNGPVQDGLARPDVGANFGDSRFNPSGFKVQAALTSGPWDVVVSVRSQHTGRYDGVRTVRVVVDGGT